MIELVCIVCPNGCRLKAENNGGKVTVTGQKCKRGEAFAAEELISPKRSVTGTVATVFSDLPVVPVRTDGEIPKEKIKELMELLKTVRLETPLNRGDTVIDNLFGTGVNLIVTSDMKRALGG